MDKNGNDNRLLDVGVIEALQLLFLGLKLSGHISWSWWLVFAPMLSKVAIVVLAGVIAAGVNAWRGE